MTANLNPSLSGVNAMNRRVFLALLLALLPLAAYAGQGTILETDDKIIIEYSGDEDAAKTSIKQKEEREREHGRIQTEDERRKINAQREENRAARRAATTPERTGD